MISFLGKLLLSALKERIFSCFVIIRKTRFCSGFPIIRKTRSCFPIIEIDILIERRSCLPIIEIDVSIERRLRRRLHRLRALAGFGVLRHQFHVLRGHDKRQGAVGKLCCTFQQKNYCTEQNWNIKCNVNITGLWSFTFLIVFVSKKKLDIQM